jgi:hypothetical protein
MKKLGLILSDVLQKKSIDKKIMEAELFINYDLIVGNKLAEVSWPTTKKNDVLFIGVENPVWSQQLYFFKQQMIKNINDYFRADVIRDIRFHLDSGCSSKTERKKTSLKSNMVKVIDSKIPDNRIKAVNKVCQEIHDDILRKKFTRLMILDSEFKIKRGGI